MFCIYGMFCFGITIMKFRDLILKSIIDPGIIVKHLHTISVSTFELIQALLFIAISSVVVTYFTFWLPSLLFKETVNDLSLVMSIVNNSPFIFVILQSIILLGMSLVIAIGGQFFNGVGSFNNALAGVLWINFILIGINLFQILLNVLKFKLKNINLIFLNKIPYSTNGKYKLQTFNNFF